MLHGVRDEGAPELGWADGARLAESCPLVASSADRRRTTIEVRGERIGAGGLTLIGGPCAVESREQMVRVAELLEGLGVRYVRGGAFKPRTSPYSFQGLRDEGLRLLEEVRREFDLRIVTEVLDAATLPAVAEVADVLQIGSRNMHNTALLDAVGRLGQPVLLKRGYSATLMEWFSAAEYVLARGNGQVILCERGIRTFETLTRNTFDVSAIPLARRLTHLPVVADPSHGVGLAWAVPAVARAAVAAGADGVMIEVHPNPDEALSDGSQALTFETFAELAPELTTLAGVRGVGRSRT
ncbi:MAG: 3-deoxy-7-phosphoheptulonate synthase [Phycisphaerae bacterium]